MMGFLKQANSRRGPALRQQSCSRRSRFLIHVSEYLFDHCRIFNAGDYFNRATTFTAGFNVDVADMQGKGREHMSRDGR